MSIGAKFIRGQVRQIVKEILPEIINEQLFEQIKKHVNERVAEVETYNKGIIDLMNTRQKEVLKYLVETHGARPHYIEPAPLTPEEVALAEEPKKD